MTMNHYGAMALEHWQRARAAELTTLQDPDRFFTDLGEQIAAEIDRRTQALEDPGMISEDYLRNVGHLTEVYRTVESDVLRELVYTDPPMDRETDPATTLGALG